MSTPKKRTASLLIILIFAALWFSAVPASAAGVADRSGSITIRYSFEGGALENAEFSLYRAAEATDGGGFEPTGEFAGYPINFDAESSGEWRSLAVTLEGYVRRDNITPYASGATGAGGDLTFDGLSDGMYLVCGESLTRDGTVYTPEPMIIFLPHLDEDNSLRYDAVTEPKKSEVPHSPDTLAVTAVKIWSDTGNESGRPGSITAELLKDGEVYDTAELSSSNNWRCTWSGLDPDSTWSVTEKAVPDGYTVLVDRADGVWLITNRIIPEAPPPAEPPKLPQTGLLWWPVPVLAAGGLSLLLLGVLLHRRASRR